MTLKGLLFGNNDSNKETKDMAERPGDKTLQGTITHIDQKGFGFIISPELKFTRIFFHWTALEQDTLNFTELKKRMKVQFIPRKYQDVGWRAIKVRVVQ